MEEAERAEREASAALTRTEWVVGQSARAGDSVAVATSPPPAQVQRVHSRSERLGDEAFFDGIVSYMASAGLVEFSAELRTAVVDKAPALLTSVRRTSFHSPELLSMRQAWSDMDHSSWIGKQKAAPTLDLVTALRRAHDETQASVLCPTPQEAQEELRRTKKRRSDSRDRSGHRCGDKDSGGGGFGRGGGHGGDSGNGGGGDSHHRPEGTAAAEAEEACLMEVVAQDAVRISDEVARAVAAPLGEATVDDGTARVVVQLVMVPLSDHPRLEARTAARSLW